MDDPKVHFSVPHWLATLYIVGSLLTVPWTINLGENLPTHHIFKHWDMVWVGLDVALILSLLLTGILAYRRSLWVVLSATASSSLLLVDAWFDVLGSHAGKELFHALLEAGVVEVPM